MADDERGALLDAIRRALVAAARSRATITYAELLAGLAHDAQANAEADLPSLLRQISLSENAAGRGLLTAVVVRADRGLPGGGFFQLAADVGRDVSDRAAAWHRELDLVYARVLPRDPAA